MQSLVSSKPSVGPYCSASAADSWAIRVICAAKLLRREGRGVRQAAGERDHFRAGGDRHQVAHRRGAHHRGPLGEEAGVALEVPGAGVGAPPVRRWRHLAHARKCGGSTPAAPGRLGFRMWTFSPTLGIGIAIGMLAGTTGTHGSARGRMTLLAAVIGLVAGFLLDGALGAVLALVGAVARLPGDQRPRRRRQPPRGQRRRRARLHRRPGGAGRRRRRAAAAGRWSSW